MSEEDPRTTFRTTLPGVSTPKHGGGRTGGSKRVNAHPIPAGTKDRGGFRAEGFKSNGFQSGQKKIETGGPPSVKSAEEEKKRKAAAAAKIPPSARYASPKTVTQPDLKPLQKPKGKAKKWPSAAKGWEYKGMRADTRSGSFPQAPLSVTHEQKTKPKTRPR